MLASGVPVGESHDATITQHTPYMVVFVPSLIRFIDTLRATRPQ
jgi:hypothetical protein